MVIVVVEEDGSLFFDGVAAVTGVDVLAPVRELRPSYNPPRNKAAGFFAIKQQQQKKSISLFFQKTPKSAIVHRGGGGVLV